MTHAKATAGSPAAGGDTRFDKVKEAIRANIDELRQLEGVVAIRPGFLFQDGWITNQPAIVLAVDPDVLADPEKLAKLPESADGVPVDLAPATPAEQLRGLQGAPGARGAAGPAIKAPEDDLALPGWEDTPSTGPGRRGPGEGPDQALLRTSRPQARGSHRCDDDHLSLQPGRRLHHPRAVPRGGQGAVHGGHVRLHRPAYPQGARGGDEEGQGGPRPEPGPEAVRRRQAQGGTAAAGPRRPTWTRTT